MTGEAIKERFDVLVISDDVVGIQMAGPGIRAWEISKSLSKHFSVALAVPDFSAHSEKDPFLRKAPFEVFLYSLRHPQILQELAKKSRILLIQGYVLSKFPSLLELPAYLIADLYVPFVFENLFNQKWRIPSLKDRENIHLHDLKVFIQQILASDHFICANSRQRDLFTGTLMTLGRINPRVLDLSPGLEEMIDLVPFGLSGETDTVRDRQFLKENFPGIEEEDIVFLWGGVLTNWFDPLNLIRAVAEAAKNNPKIKVLFLSTKHANPLLPDFDMAEKAIRLSDELGLSGRSVFFNHSWVSYDQRGRYFSSSDVGLSINSDHFENRFAARTRMLDYLKYSLPILCTGGDEFSATVKEKFLGKVVKPGDTSGLKGALLALAGEKGQREMIRKNVAAIKDNFLWERTTEPLVSHCRSVLAGRIGKKSRPTPWQLRFLFFQPKESALKKSAKTLLWKPIQKLPFRLTSKLKRLLRT